MALLDAVEARILDIGLLEWPVVRRLWQFDIDAMILLRYNDSTMRGHRYSSYFVCFLILSPLNRRLRFSLDLLAVESFLLRSHKHAVFFL